MFAKRLIVPGTFVRYDDWPRSNPNPNPNPSPNRLAEVQPEPQPQS